jgi:hypothetical protein
MARPFGAAVFVSDPAVYSIGRAPSWQSQQALAFRWSALFLDWRRATLPLLFRAPDLPWGCRMNHSEMASPKLRRVFAVVAASMFLLWGWSLIPPIENWNNPNEDGFSFVPTFYATLICLPAGIFLLAGAIAGRDRHLARGRPALFIGAATLFVVVAFLIFQYIANSMGGL